MTWDYEEWVTTWGYNACLIASEWDTRLPKLPAGYGWLTTRDVEDAEPAVTVSLYEVHPIDMGVQYDMLYRGTVNYAQYGDAGVINLASNILNESGIVDTNHPDLNKQRGVGDG